MINKMSRYIFPFLFTLLLSCSQTSTKKVPPLGFSFEVKNNDTFNRIDNNGKKQGKWYLIDSFAKIYTIKDSIFYKDGVVLKN
ncbi:MAG: hypothetical protein JWO32_1677 [Bacteroidetes bacterium]|nr:hypothetical protein [Bacteroidota bacterium]